MTNHTLKSWSAAAGRLLCCILLPGCGGPGGTSPDPTCANRFEAPSSETTWFMAACGPSCPLPDPADRSEITVLVNGLGHVVESIIICEGGDGLENCMSFSSGAAMVFEDDLIRLDAPLFELDADGVPVETGSIALRGQIAPCGETLEDLPNSNAVVFAVEVDQVTVGGRDFAIGKMELTVVPSLEP